ncbi:MAG: DNA primase [Usitatibacter sp.]
MTGRDRWLACCPAHEDRHPSLSIREVDDGRVLVHCFAGCAVDDVLAAVGLDFDALSPPKPIGHARPERKPYRVQDVITALDFELTVALIYLADIREGREIADRERAGECRARVVRFMEELRLAS